MPDSSLGHSETWAKGSAEAGYGPEIVAENEHLRDAYTSLELAAAAVADWWHPRNAKTRSFEVWFDETLPNLREALGLPRSMADEEN